MAFTVSLPDARKMKDLSDQDFANAAAGKLSMYDLKSAAFNMAAATGSNRIVMTPASKGRMFLHEEEDQPVISASLKVLEEFDKTAKVSTATRERYLIELTKDVLRNLKFDPETLAPIDHNSETFKRFEERTMRSLADDLAGIASITMQIPSYGTAKYNFKR